MKPLNVPATAEKGGTGGGDNQSDLGAAPRRTYPVLSQQAWFDKCLK